ncbi:MAG TPA: PKD domain-containing protein [Bacteroidia bacterium]|nr:PKD domain-containing protein [Bacteroidia bacterium]
MSKHGVSAIRCIEFYLLIICIIVCIYFYPAQSQQNSYCTNSGFELGNFSNWTGYTGDCCVLLNAVNGIVTGRHTIMSGNGTDPNTNNVVKVVAPGTNYSARLGNQNVGAQSEQLTFSFLVTPQTALFVYRYAVVLEDPGHSPSNQPRFQIRVYDQSTQLIGCGQYSVVASGNIQGFVTTTVNGRTVVYKDWSAVGIDLSASMGNTITIEFTTTDCGIGGHFGYAYISAYCSPLSVEAAYCIGNYSAMLTAPAGFASYVWSTGDTTQSLNISNPVNGTVYQCMLTSFTGCTVTLSTVLTPTTVKAGFTTAALCLDYVSFIDTSITNNSSVAGWLWNFGDGATDSSMHPVHTYQVPGNYNVTLIAISSGGCHDTVVQQITLNNAPAAYLSYTGYCEQQEVNFTNTSVTPNASVISSHWLFGDGDSATALNPNHIYATEGIYPVILTIQSSDGCFDSTLQYITIYNKPQASFYASNQCLFSNVNFYSTSIGRKPIETYLWNFNGTNVLGDSTMSYVFTTAGTQHVSLQITNVLGCVADTAIEITLTDTLKASFNYTPTHITTALPVAYIINTSLGNLSYYVWNTGAAFATGSNYNPTLNFETYGSYPVQLYAENVAGCKDSVLEIIEVAPLNGIYIPNAFTPQGDLVNDFFKPQGEAIKEYVINIYNRWGQLIFEGNINQPWNGMYLNKQALKGNYVYLITGKDVFDTPFTKTGSIMVMR